MRWILFAFTAPYSVVVGWGWVGLMYVAQAANELRWDKYGVLTAEWRPWVCKFWRYSTTLGRGIIYQPGIRREFTNRPLTRVEAHEMVHIRQVEDMMVLSFIIGVSAWLATGSWLLALCIWVSGGAWQLPNFITAWLRGGDPYRDSEHERSAYAQTDGSLPGGKSSWLDRREVEMQRK